MSAFKYLSICLLKTFYSTVVNYFIRINRLHIDCGSFLPNGLLNWNVVFDL